MKDQFQIILLSNSSMQYYSKNTTARFLTQLPRQINLQGSWSVALTEMRIPLTFQHVSQDPKERFVHVTRIPYSRTVTNKVKTNDTASDNLSLVSPGIYKNITTLLDEINSLHGVSGHLEFSLQRGGYVSIIRKCSQTTCQGFDHEVAFSPKLRRILGFEEMFASSPFIKLNLTSNVCSNRPANLSSALPSILMIYTDICEPYVTGDVQSKLLRTVSLNMEEYAYGGVKVKSFSPPLYIPLLCNAFQTIEINILDDQGLPAPFDFGTSSLSLHFKRSDY